MSFYSSMGFSVPRSNILSGIGSSIGIGGNYYRFDQFTPSTLADTFALQSDWKAVGNDLHSCMHDQYTGFLPLKAENHRGW